MVELSLLNEPVTIAVGWFYLTTNSARVITYAPQIIAVWRCTDGARAISLLTWGSWMLSHLTAMVYGVLVVGDGFFVTISAINFTGCSLVTVIAARRRRNARAQPEQPEATGAEKAQETQTISRLDLATANTPTHGGVHDAATHRIPVFETQGQTERDDRGFHAKVQEAIDSKKPRLPHDEVMHRMTQRLEKLRQRRAA